MEITGKLPKILADEIEFNSDNVVVNGTDIDITITENGRDTELSAITLGNGKWEIDEIDDNANIFPEYDVGDVISLDVLKKIFVTSSGPIANSYHIFSFNLLGKIKYGLTDFEKNIKQKTKGVTDFFTDDLDKETAQKFIREYYDGANVGQIEKINDVDGATFKVLFGVPSEEKFYVGCLHRNGNDIRFLDDDDFPDTPLYSFTDPDYATKGYDNYPKLEGTDEDPDNPGESEDEDFEFTKENIDEALGNELATVDFEEIEEDEQKIEGQPTAVALSSKSEGDDYTIDVCKLVYDGEKVHVQHEFDSMYEIPSERYLLDTLAKALNKYREFGGKKDLTYLLKKKEGDDSEENTEDLTEEEPNQVTEPGTTGESDGVQWEVTQGLKRKKSKYNGKNVTGYQDGMLGEMAVASHHLFSRCLLKSSLEIKLTEFIASALSTADLKSTGDSSVVADKLRPALKKIKAEYADEARRIAAMWTRAKTIDEFIDIMKTPTVEGIARKGFVKLCCDDPKKMQKLIEFLSKINPK